MLMLTLAESSITALAALKRAGCVEVAASLQVFLHAFCMHGTPLERRPGAEMGREVWGGGRGGGWKMLGVRGCWWVCVEGARVQ